MNLNQSIIIIIIYKVDVNNYKEKPIPSYLFCQIFDLN